MRLLFRGDKTYADLLDLSSVSMNEKELIRAIGSCLDKRLIKKLMVEPSDGEVTDVTIAADLLGVRPKKKKITTYHLTKSGFGRIAYWDYFASFHEHATLPVLMDDDERYFSEANQHMEDEQRRYAEKHGTA